MPSGATYPGGLTFSTDKNRLWLADETKKYIFEIGTANSAVYGSFTFPIGYTGAGGWHVGLAFASDKNRLWFSHDRAKYVCEIGTTDYNAIGSFKTINTGLDGIVGIEFTPDYYLLGNDIDSGRKYIIQMGTAYGRAYSGTYVHFQTPFSAQPTIAIGQIGDIGNKSVFIMEPSPGSFWLKAGTYPAKASWMAWGSR